MAYEIFLGIGAAVAVVAIPLVAMFRISNRTPVMHEGPSGLRDGPDPADVFDVLPAAPEGARVEVAVKTAYTCFTDDERAVLLEMDTERGWSLQRLVSRTGIPAKRVTAARVALRAAGLAVYGPLFDDEGHLRGTGYTLTVFGDAARGALAAEIANNDPNARALAA